MKNLSLNTSITQRLSNIFKQIASLYHIEMVFLYGSCACGKAQGHSDIDLAILFSDEIDNSKEKFCLLTEITRRLTCELSKVAYPTRERFSNEVNIISIEKDFPHPMLYYNAIVMGIPIFIKDSEKFLSLKLQAIYQMEDFQIYGVDWQREIISKIMQEVGNA